MKVQLRKTGLEYNGSVELVLKAQHPNLPAVIINANQTKENFSLLTNLFHTVKTMHVFLFHVFDYFQCLKRII